MVNYKKIREKASKLNPKQKRAAKLLALGFRPSKIVKKLKVNHTTLWKWRKLPKFQKLFDKYWKEIDAYVESKQKHAFTRAFEVAVKLMNYPNWKAQATGAQMVLNMHKQAGMMVHKHEGAIEMKHDGEVKLKKITKEQKKNIKELLEVTRDLVSPN